MSDWLKKVQAADGLELDESVQQLSGDPDPARPGQPVPAKVPESYEEVLELNPKIGEWVEWLKELKRVAEYQQATERLIQEALSDMGITNLQQIPELYTFFQNN